MKNHHLCSWFLIVLSWISPPFVAAQEAETPHEDRYKKIAADISQLAKLGVPTIGLWVDGQRYFDYHHSDLDVINTLNERELELGAAAVAILANVLAKEGLPPKQ